VRLQVVGQFGGHPISALNEPAFQRDQKRGGRQLITSYRRGKIMFIDSDNYVQKTDLSGGVTFKWCEGYGGAVASKRLLELAPGGA
jgi:hypothetical protein